MMKIFKYIPIYLILFFIYNIVVISYHNNAQIILDENVFELNLPSGALIIFNLNNILIMVSILFLYIEIFKATYTHTEAIIEHVVSIIILLIFVIEFFLFKNFASCTALILIFISLVDVVGGITISITAARRDISLAK